VAGFVDEPFAAAVIYPASLAAWTGLALAVTSPLAALVTAIAVFLGFARLSLRLIRAMEHDLLKGTEQTRKPNEYEQEPDGPPALLRLFRARKKRRRVDDPPHPGSPLLPG
jgi:hypothetical protein